MPSGLPAQTLPEHEARDFSASGTAKDVTANGHQPAAVKTIALAALGAATIPVDLPEPFSANKNWSAYNLAQTNEKGLFKQLLYALCAIIPEPPPNESGRPLVPVRDLAFGETYRTYTGLSGRRFQTDVTECANAELLSRHYGRSKGWDFLNNEWTTDLLRALITESAKPLQGIERHFAPDSTGFGTNTYDRWQEEKHGNKRTGTQYVKAHIITGVDTHIITAAAASVQQIGDITAMPALLDETRGAGFSVDEITADGAYLSKENLERLDALGIDAYIPFRTNSRFHHDGSLWDTHLAFFLLNRSLFEEHYHRRSQVESTFSMVKTKYGSSVRGKCPASQANGVLLKLLANNLYVLIRAIYELGIHPEFTKIGLAPQLGRSS